MNSRLFPRLNRTEGIVYFHKGQINLSRTSEKPLQWRSWELCGLASRILSDIFNRLLPFKEPWANGLQKGIPATMSAKDKENTDSFHYRSHHNGEHFLTLEYIIWLAANEAQRIHHQLPLREPQRQFKLLPPTPGQAPVIFGVMYVGVEMNLGANQARECLC